MRRTRLPILLIGVSTLMFCAGCGPHATPAARAQWTGPVRVHAYPPARVIAVIRLALEVPGPQGQPSLGEVQLVPWAGDADRFVFQATFFQPVTPGPWNLTSLVKGNVDMRTGHVQLLSQAPVAPDVLNGFSRHGVALEVVPPGERTAQRNAGMGRLNTK